MKKNKIAEEILNALYEAAEQDDLKRFIEIIDRNRESLPADLIEARMDPEVVEEAMKLIGEGLAVIEPDGIRLRYEESPDYFPEKFH